MGQRGAHVRHALPADRVCVMARITHKMRIEALMNTALSAISMVGYANYVHREKAAMLAVRLSAETGKYVDPETILED